ncbi:hypothetical protein BLAT2472_30413 [Burkholderia latens]
MRQRQDRQHVQDTDPRKDADAERHGARALCNASQAVRRPGRAVTAAVPALATSRRTSVGIALQDFPLPYRNFNSG